MNGDFFQKLNRLRGVWMMNNVCIDEDFNSQERIAIIPQTIEKCKFDEDEVHSSARSSNFFLISVNIFSSCLVVYVYVFTFTTIV